MNLIVRYVIGHKVIGISNAVVVKVLEAVNQDIICACVQKQALDLKKVCIFAMHIHCVGTGPLVVYRPEVGYH